VSGWPSPAWPVSCKAMIVWDRTPIPILVKVISREMPYEEAPASWERVICASSRRTTSAVMPNELRALAAVPSLAEAKASSMVPGANGEAAISQGIPLGQGQHFPSRAGETRQLQQGHHGNLPTGASPGLKSYSAVRSGQAAAERMILWPAPSTRAQPSSRGASGIPKHQAAAT